MLVRLGMLKFIVTIGARIISYFPQSKINVSQCYFFLCTKRYSVLPCIKISSKWTSFPISIFSHHFNFNFFSTNLQIILLSKSSPSVQLVVAVGNLWTVYVQEGVLHAAITCNSNAVTKIYDFSFSGHF